MDFVIVWIQGLESHRILLGSLNLILTIACMILVVSGCGRSREAKTSDAEATIRVRAA